MGVYTAHGDAPDRVVQRLGPVLDREMYLRVGNVAKALSVPLAA